MQLSCRTADHAVDARRISRCSPRCARGRIIAASAVALLPQWTCNADAQVSGSIAVTNDYRLRGRTLSDSRGAVIATAAYDDRSGAYGEAAVIGSTGHGGGPRLLGAVGNVGYAMRLANGITVDAGASRAEFSVVPGSRRRGYTELYFGANHRDLSASVRYSPDYFRPGNATIYLEANAALRPMAGWRLLGHVGSLFYLNRAFASAHVQHDWRLGLARRVGTLDAQVAVSGGGPGADFYNGGGHSRTALTVVLSRPF